MDKVQAGQYVWVVESDMTVTKMVVGSVGETVCRCYPEETPLVVSTYTPAEMFETEHEAWCHREWLIAVQIGLL